MLQPLALALFAFVLARFCWASIHRLLIRRLVAARAAQRVENARLGYYDDVSALPKVKPARSLASRRVRSRAWY